ncbi:YppE family protein [Paenisporosarcina sp.]|uniref:YppE family protein n=1 Tax=Paenisporosarcina sp. TaxID=1932001 RepID=UPI003C713DF9
MTLLEQTKLVLEESNKCLSRHQEMRDTDSTPDFFSQVKPHADHWHTFLKEWRELSRKWLDDNRPKHMRIQQIDAAIEAFNQYVVQSFYKDTGKKRFAQSIQSTCYTLQTYINALEQEGGKLEKETNNQ